MRVLVCGGRLYSDMNRVFQVLDHIDMQYGINTIIHGGAKGADSLANLWAKERKKNVKIYHPDWTKGKSGGILRNIRMLNESEPDLVIAFPGGTGTNHMISITEKTDVPIIKLE